MKYPQMVAQHVRDTTQPSRRWQWLLRDCETLARSAVVCLLGLLAVDAIGHALAWAWWMAEHWTDLPQ